VRRTERLVGLLAVLVLTASCATVPTSGPVEHHQPQQGGASNGVQVAPLPPAVGATQLLVVEGFLHAMGTYEDGYRVARQYLTTEAANRWHPESGVQVYADGYPPAETEQTAVLIAPVTGAVDATGVYRATGGQLRQDFGLVKDDEGQWRISNPPEGLLVSRYLFATGFEPVEVYFGSTGTDVLLPDPRYFPVGESALTRAANAVLEGPSPWLAPLTAARPSPGVVVDSVVLHSSGSAMVYLGGETSTVTAERRELLLAELVFTLGSFDQVRTVQVNANGAAWTNKVGRSELTPQSFSDLDPVDVAGDRPAYVVRADKLQRQLSQGNWVDFVEVQAGFAKVGELAIARGSRQWAGVTDASTKLVAGTVAEKGSRVLREGSGLLRPFYSRTGDLWSPAAAVADWLIFHDGSELKLRVKGVPKGRVVAAKLAADGSRLAVVVAHGTTTSVGLLRVRRGTNSVVVEGWQAINLNLLPLNSVTLLDVGWESATELALLRTDVDRQTSVIVVSQDGAQLSDIGPSDATGLRSLLVVPGRPAMSVSAGGGLYRFDGEFNWMISSSGVSAAAYPG